MEKCTQKRKPKKAKTFSFWLPYGFICSNFLVHPLENKSRWLKMFERGYFPFLYLKRKNWPSLITAWKRLLLKANVKTIMGYYDNFAACFGNKWNFMKWRSNCLKFFTKIEPFKVCDLPHSYIHLGVFQGLRMRLHVFNGQAWL